MRRSIGSRGARRRLAATLARTLAVKADQAADPTGTPPRPVGLTGRLSDTPSGVDVAAAPAASKDEAGAGPATGGTSPGERPDVVDVGAGRSPQRRRRLLVPAIAVVVTGALVGALVVVRSVGSEDGSPDAETVLTVPAGPEGWLVPTWVPEAMDIWNVQWSTYDEPDGGGGAGDGWSNFQLFGDPDAGRALYIQAGPDNARDVADDEPITVRGHRGWAGPSIDTEAPVDGITWTEQGANVTALFRGMTTAEAIAAVEAMEWRSGSAERGFAPPADGSMPLRGQSLDAQRHTGRSASFVFSEGPPALDPAAGGLGLAILTSTQRGMPLGYLDDWFYRGDETTPDDDGARHTFDAESRDLRVDWPDGREVYISPLSTSADGTQPDRETLERIVDSVVVGNEADLDVLRDRFTANVGSVPVIASAGTGVGTLELHGEGDFRRLCLSRPGAEPSLDCGQSPSVTGDSIASWVVDGVWYVGVAAPGYEPQLLDGHDPAADESIPGETATDGDWRFLLVQPPPDVRAVMIPSDAASSSGLVLSRPS